MARLDGDSLAAWVAASCAASGVPVFVTDPVVLRQVAVVSAGVGGGGAQRGSAAPPRPPRLYTPGDGYAGRFDAAGSLGAGADGDVADQGPDDCGLSA